VRQDALFGDFSYQIEPAPIMAKRLLMNGRIFFYPRAASAQKRKFLGFFFLPFRMGRVGGNHPLVFSPVERACQFCASAQQPAGSAEMTMRCLLLVLFLNECALNRNPVCAGNTLSIYIGWENVPSDKIYGLSGVCVGVVYSITQALHTFHNEIFSFLISVRAASRCLREK
jgi:hypothetical protein